MIMRRRFVVGLVLVAALPGCHGRHPSSTKVQQSSITIVDPATEGSKPRYTSQEMRFADVSGLAGITWTFNNGGNLGKVVLDQLGAGVAFIDYNNDGLLDIFAVQGGPLPGATGDAANFSKRNVLYRNNGDGTFTDVTTTAGLDEYTGYGMGVSVADYDNDGWPDIYVTAYGGNHLFHNNHNGTFTDVTAKAGVDDVKPLPGSTSAPLPTSSTWVDYDRDGRLDLFVCHYYLWSPDMAESRPCDATSLAHRVNCGPEQYPMSHCRLFRSNGDGTFTDVSEKAGLFKISGKSLGVALIDYDDDGWPDLFVTNDVEPNNLLHNNRDGTFTDVASASGVALNEKGQASAGMGIGVGDYDNDGREDLFVVNFARQMKSVYHNLGSGVFENTSYASGMGGINLEFLGFGMECFDYDLDGYKDLIYANGHILQVYEWDKVSSYPQSQQILHNQGNGTFVDDQHSLGDLAAPMVGRGLAVGDVDNDGDLDVAIMSQTGALKLYRNDGGNKNAWVTFRLEGVNSNRDAIGAKVTVKAGASTQVQWVRGGSSYCSHSDTRVTFGLGKLTGVTSGEIRWPDGTKQALDSMASNTSYYVREGAKPTPDPRVHVRMAN